MDGGPDDWVIPGSAAPAPALGATSVPSSGAPSGSAPSTASATPLDAGPDDWITPSAPPPSTSSDVGHAAGSSLVQGTIEAAGTPGSLLDAIGNASEYGLQRLAKWSGLAPATAQPQSYADIAAANKKLTAGTNILPRSDDLMQAVHDDTGYTPYEPQTLAGKFVGKTAEFLPSTMLGPEGLVAKGVLAGTSAAGDLAAQSATKGTWLEPYAEMAGAVGGGVAGGLALGAAKSIAPALSSNAAEKAGLQSTLNVASDPAKLRQDVTSGAGAQPAVPGVNYTSFQAFGDTGLGDMERALSVRNPRAFVENDAGTGTQQQNQALVGAVNGIPAGQGGDAMAVPDLFMNRLQNLNEFHDYVAGQADQVAKSHFDALGGNGTAAETGQAIKNQIDPAYATARDTANAAAAAVPSFPQGNAATTLGGDLQGRLAALGDVSDQAASDLWGAVPKNVSLDIGSVQDAADGIYGNMTRAGQQSITPGEATVRNLLDGYAPQVPFAEGKDFNTVLTGAMRAARTDPMGRPAYGRLAQIKGAWEQNLQASLGAQDAADQSAVAAGTMDPSETLGAKLQAATGNGGAPGAPAFAFTPAGTKIGTDYGVVDLGDLTASHAPDGTPNPAFPADLQPRDRSRPASVLQVNDMASNLQPERLGFSTSTTDGAPIVGPDGVVESGNGRVAALAKAYAQGGPQASAYRDFLTGQGYDTSGMDRPMLIRQRTTDLSPDERVALARESNAPTVLAQSATERAEGDAGKISDGLLSTYQGGDVASAANRPFVRGFLDAATEPNERGALAGPDGTLSIEGAQRARNALLHVGYGDSRLVSSLAETGDPDIAAFGRALQDNAGAMGQLRRGVMAGDIHPGADLSGHAVEAARVVQRARSSGQPLRAVVDQADAFSPVSREARTLLQAGYGEDLDGRLSRSRLNSVLSDAIGEAQQQQAGARLFGEPLDAHDLIEGARTRYAARQGSGTADPLADGARYPGASARADRGEGGQPGPRAGWTESTGGRQGRGIGPGGAAQARLSASSRVLPELLGPPLSGDDLAAYGKARAATIEHINTYRKGVVGQILKRGETAADGLKTDAAAVPSLAFPKGPKGAAAVAAIRRASGSDAGAADALHNIAAMNLRREAIGPDGTFDPGRYAKFMRPENYGSAMSAMPDSVKAAFANAGTARAALDRFGAYTSEAAPTHVAEMFFAPGTAGSAGVRNLRNLIGDDAANEILTDHAASVYKAAHPDAEMVTDRGHADFLKKYGPAIDALPGLRDRFADAAAAARTTGDVAAARKQAVADFLKGEAKPFMGLEHASEVRDAVGRLIDGNDVKGAARLMRSVAPNPAATEGVQAAARAHIVDKMLSPAEDSDLQVLNKGTLRRGLTQNSAAMRTILGDDAVNRLQAVSADATRIMRAHEVMKMPAGPNTAHDLTRVAKMTPSGHGSLLSQIFEAAVAGRELGGENGGFYGAAAALGNRVKQALGDAGMRRTHDVMERIAQDPEFLRTLLVKYPKLAGTGSHLTLANRLRRYSMYRVQQADVAAQDDRREAR